MRLSVETATIHTTLGRASEGIYGAFRARVGLKSGRTVTAFVKLLAPEQVAVEVQAALLGRLLGLPIPDPLVTRWGSRIGFGSTAVDDSLTFARLPEARRADSMRLFLSWTKLFSVACFDEWIANSDRHGGNVLVTALDEYWLIDHQLALPEGLAPDALGDRNQLFERIADSASCERDREKSRALARTRASELIRLAVPPELENVLDDIEELRKPSKRAFNFITARMAHLVKLCEHRTPIAQLEIPAGHND